MIEDVNNRFTQIQNVSKGQPGEATIAKQLVMRQLVRSADDMEKWSVALRIAESVESPDRTELQRIYKNMEIDGHITGIINAIKHKIKRKGFMLVDSNGDENEEETAKLEAEWFFKYLDWNVEAPFYGYSLIELGEIVDDQFPNINMINRQYVVPDLDAVKTDLFRVSNDSDVIHYLEDPFVDWNIFIGEKTNLGLFNAVAPVAIAKKHIMAAMWEYVELFGIPIRQGHTDTRDPSRKKNMERMLDNMGSAAWGVFDTDDEIKLVEGTTGNTDIFIEPLKHANEEISKTFAGSTGVFDEKSFVGSAEVQERLFNEMIISMQRQIQFDNNNKLVPRMVKHGMIKDGLTFKWKQEDALSTLQKAEVITNFLPFFQISPDEIEKETGLKVESIVVSGDVKQENAMARLKAIYKGYEIPVKKKKD